MLCVYQNIAARDRADGFTVDKNVERDIVIELFVSEETKKTGTAYRQQDLARTLEAAAEIDKNAERVVHAHRAVMMPLTKLFGKRFKIVADRKLHLRYSL